MNESLTAVIGVPGELLSGIDMMARDMSVLTSCRRIHVVGLLPSPSPWRSSVQGNPRSNHLQISRRNPPVRMLTQQTFLQRDISFKKLADGPT